MAEDDSDQPMSADEMIASAHEIIDQLRDRWRESGLPISVLANQMLGAAITDCVAPRLLRRAARASAQYRGGSG
jgi:hypothetical protein